jgi:hypothetical protein
VRSGTLVPLRRIGYRVTNKIALVDTPLAVAVIVTAVLVRTLDVLMVKFAVLIPPETFKVLGTEAIEGLLLVKRTTAPVAADKVRAPVTLFPPRTDDRERVIAVGTAGPAPR